MSLALPGVRRRLMQLCARGAVALTTMWRYVALRRVVTCVAIGGRVGDLARCDVSTAVTHGLKMAIWRYVALRGATWRWGALCVPYVSITPLPEVSSLKTQIISAGLSSSYVHRQTLNLTARTSRVTYFPFSSLTIPNSA